METNRKGYPHRQASKTKKTEAEGNLTRPKGRPRRDGNRRFERVRKTDKQKPQQQSKAEPVENELKPERRYTTRNTRRNRHQERECSPSDKEETRSRRRRLLSERKPAEMQGKQHPDNLGTAKGEPTVWKTTGGVAKAKSSRRRRKLKTQEEVQRTERNTPDRKGGEKQEGTARTAAGGNFERRMETSHRSHSTWKRTLRKNIRSRANLSMQKR